MKKWLCTLVLLGSLFLTSGCLNEDALEGAQIYTSVYPITYLTEELFKENGTISSIFPDGSDVSNYQLTSKQIKEYSKGEIFIYNGLSNEKQIAKSLLEANKNLKIIDVSYGLKYAESTEELWLSPNYALMLAITIKNNLQELITSKYIQEEIEKNYDLLEEKLSLMDAELRSVAKSATQRGTNTIIAANNVFKFLENYGYTVISLEDSQYSTQSAINTLKNDFKSNKYKYVFIKQNAEQTDVVKDLVASNNASLVPVNTMETLSKDAKDKNEDYLTIMNTFLENIKEATLN